MEDAAIIETLTRVKGVGVWTVQMFLMFALAASQRPAGGRLGCARGYEESLRLSGAAQTARNGIDRRSLAPLPQRRELVHVAEPGKSGRRLILTRPSRDQSAGFVAKTAISTVKPTVVHFEYGLHGVSDFIAA